MSSIAHAHARHGMRSRSDLAMLPKVFGPMSSLFLFHLFSDTLSAFLCGTCGAPRVISPRKGQGLSGSLSRIRLLAGSLASRGWHARGRTGLGGFPTCFHRCAVYAFCVFIMKGRSVTRGGWRGEKKKGSVEISPSASDTQTLGCPSDGDQGPMLGFHPFASVPAQCSVKVTLRKGPPSARESAFFLFEKTPFGFLPMWAALLARA